MILVTIPIQWVLRFVFHVATALLQVKRVQLGVPNAVKESTPIQQRIHYVQLVLQANTNPTKVKVVVRFVIPADSARAQILYAQLVQQDDTLKIRVQIFVQFVRRVVTPTLAL